MAGRARGLTTVTADTPLGPSGRVVALSTPGHTPGHLSLLVRLPGRSYILTGDLVHQREQIASATPSGNHVDKARGKAEIERLKTMARREDAVIVVGHDAQDIGLLPAFPAAAR